MQPERATPNELRELDLLASLSDPQLAELAHSCPVERLGPGQALLQAGCANQTLFVVLDGELGVYLRGSDEPPIAVLGPGDTVGELSIMDGQATSALVAARTAARVLAIDESTFWLLVGTCHELAVGLLRRLAARLRANNRAVLEQRDHASRLERAAYVDGLTGALNRRWFDEMVPRLIARHRAEGAPLSLLALDIDHFKRFNDDHGHAAGDVVLRAVGAMLRRCVRPLDHAIRLGGEEFVIVLPQTSCALASAAAERLRRQVSLVRCTGPDGQALPAVTTSVGVTALCPHELADDATRLLARADTALYRAKRAGRDRVSVLEFDDPGASMSFSAAVGREG